MELCVPFFISNHANAVKVDTFSQTEKKRKHARKRRFAMNKNCIVGQKSVISDN
jgi:hypothetical protein